MKTKKQFISNHSNLTRFKKKSVKTNLFFPWNEIKNRHHALTYDDVLLCPQKSGIRSRKDPDLKTHLTQKIQIKTPFISANMDTITEHEMAIKMNELGSFGILHRFMSIPKQVKETQKVKKKSHNVGASIGVSLDYKKRAKALIQAGANIMTVDIAHGHSQAMIDTIKWLKDTFPKIEVIAGNIVTPEAAIDLAESGADAVKVGIGPGSMCTTRIVTGCGLSQLTAISLCKEALLGKNVPIIADGGLRYSGDIMKALAAGANTVMLGFLLAGTIETPTPIKKGYKIYRGMASKSAYVSWKGELSKNIAIEGESMRVPVKGPVENVIDELTSGLKSGMSYINASKINEINEKALFMKVTPHNDYESKAHGLYFNASVVE